MCIRDRDDAVGNEAGGAALDVKELLHADVGAKAGFGDDVVAQPQRQLVGQDGGVAVGDVGKRPGVDEGGLPFQRLQQVGVQRILHEHRYRAGHAQVVEGDGLAVLVGACLLYTSPPHRAWPGRTGRRLTPVG